jgi:hypothetical protein
MSGCIRLWPGGSWSNIDLLASTSKTVGGIPMHLL